MISTITLILSDTLMKTSKSYPLKNFDSHWVENKLGCMSNHSTGYRKRGILLYELIIWFSDCPRVMMIVCVIVVYLVMSCQRV